MLRSHRLSVLAALLTVLVVPATASAATDTFAYTGGVQTWTVPAGVYSATFTASGAAGATSGSAYGGKGAAITATLGVTPGQVLELRVGGNGSGVSGGFNGGGNGATSSGFAGGGGGGASDVRRPPYTPADRSIVAAGAGGGGGGGSSYSANVQARGGDSAGSGGEVNGSLHGDGGGAATGQEAGGTGGGGGVSYLGFGHGGTNGDATTGGTGGAPTYNTSAGGGGGGGGGWSGGGGGGGGSEYDWTSVGAGGGGGGGANFVDPAATNVTIVNGARSGAGLITVEYSPLAAVTTRSASGVTETGATLNAVVNPDGVETTYRFDYGETTAYGQTTDPVVLPGDGDAHDVSAAIGGLAPGTTYHFRIAASTAGGEVTGEDVAFTTVTPPAPTSGDGGGTATASPTQDFSATSPLLAGDTTSTSTSVPATTLARGCHVPRVVGKTLLAAKRALARAGCVVGRIRHLTGPKSKRGRVVAQRPAGGVRPAGTKIGLTVGLGPRRGHA